MRVISAPGSSPGLYSKTAAWPQTSSKSTSPWSGALNYMDLLNTSSSRQPQPDPTAFAGWGGLVAAVLGLIIGLFTRHWAGWTVGLGLVGYFVGAIVDRSRLN